jgi:phosphoribosyl 1,2-cyclic phosphodiesterase
MWRQVCAVSGKPWRHNAKGPSSGPSQRHVNSRPFALTVRRSICGRLVGRRKGSSLQVSFYGVRGSCPCSGEGYLRYGGHTACIAVEVAGEAPIVIDLGTGLRPLGYDLEQKAGPGKPVEMTALLSHLHWDHIIGLPFCTPLLRAGGRMDLFGPPQETGALHNVVDTVVKPPFFPVTVRDLEGYIQFNAVADDDMAVGGAKIKTRLVPHLGTTLGFRIEANGASVAVVCDHQAPQDRNWVAPGVLELCDGADLVIHDAQYTEPEYELKGTWGHSTFSYAVHVASEAGARKLVLFHHDPTHFDDDIDRILTSARELPEAGRLEDVFAAAEGDVFAIGAK